MPRRAPRRGAPGRRTPPRHPPSATRAGLSALSPLVDGSRGRPPVIDPLDDRFIPPTVCAVNPGVTRCAAAPRHDTRRGRRLLNDPAPPVRPEERNLLLRCLLGLGDLDRRDAFVVALVVVLTGQ